MRIKDVIISAITCSILLLAWSCDKRPDNVLSEDEMVSLLTDLQMAEAYYSTLPSGAKNEERRVLEESVLKKHGVSREELEATIAYYSRNLDDYTKLYDKVEKNLKDLTGTYGTETNSGTDDIWPYGRWSALMPNQISDGISFSIPADNIEAGNVLEWGMRLTSSEGAEIILGVEYEGGISSISKKNAGGSRNLAITFQTDTALVAKRIFGTMTVPSRSMPLWVDSIRLSKTEYDSLEYSKIRSQHTIRQPGKKPLQSVEEIDTDLQVSTQNKESADTTLKAVPTRIQN